MKYFESGQLSVLLNNNNQMVCFNTMLILGIRFCTS